MIWLAMLGDARDFQRSFREVWGMPYVAVPTPAAPRWAFGPPAVPIRPGPYEIDEADLQHQNEAWAERLRGRSDIPA